MNVPAQDVIMTRLAQTRRDQGEASNPALSVWVSANAGTGKTHVLTMRVLRLLLAGTEPQAILCLTYTKAAAAEMSKRVFNELAKWVTLPETKLAAELEKLTGASVDASIVARARMLFAIAIETPGGLKIQTIHAFAERLLQRFPLEAGVAPGFAILDEEEAAALRREAIGETLAKAMRQPQSALGQALAVAIRYAAGDQFDDILTAALSERSWLTHVAQIGFEGAETMLREAFAIRAGAERAAVEDELGTVLSADDLARLQAALEGGSKKDTEAAEVIKIARTAASAPGRAAALGDFFLTGKGEPRASLMTKAVKSAHPDLDAKTSRAQARYAALARELSGLDAVTATMALSRLADDVMGNYALAKSRRAALDFDDLIARTSSLIRTKDSAQWVLYKLDSALAHILVDESQDTAPAQWQIIAALASEFFSGTGQREDVRTLFAVGDEKQSIYSFQGAEAEQFARMGEAFTKAAAIANVKWRRVPLNLSFRTVEPVLNAVDTVFSDAQRTPGVVTDGQAIVHYTKRLGHAGLVEIWPTETYDAPGDADPWSPLEEEAQPSPVVRLANRIAMTIRRWLDEKEPLASEGRPIRPGDILILVRKRNPFAAPMTAALKALDIPVAGSDRIQLTEQIAVQDVMALCDFITLPEDDLALACVLKSPMFGLDDDDLLALAPARKGTLWKALLRGTELKPEYKAAAEQLKLWRARADFLPPYEFLSSILDKDGIRARLIGRIGPDAAEALDELVSLALTYDDHAPPSLSGFINWLRSDTREIKRDMEHGRNEVRVMTVHGAKGLEAPIVFLPDTCTTASAGRQGGGLVKLAGLTPDGAPDLFVWAVKGTSGLDPIVTARAEETRRDTAERNRLLYVAMTRARDRLYVAGFEGKLGRARGCWWDLVSDGLGERAERVRDPQGNEVRRYSCEQAVPPEPREEVTATLQGVTALPAWAAKPAPREPQLSIPLAPSRLAPYEPDEDGEPLPRFAPRDALAEPAGQAPAMAATDQSRFLKGTLTHALLHYLPGLEPNSWAKAAKAFLAARAAQLPARTQATIVRETLEILNHPDFAPLFGPGSQAEVPIVAAIPRPHGRGPALKLTGQIDRLVDTGSSILIVDYKTNNPPARDPEAVADVYIYQLAAYRLALEAIYPGRIVRAALLWTASPALMEISSTILDAYAERLWTLDPARLDAER